MMYPLVRELADDGIPVTVSCRVLGLARQPFYRWLTCPFTDAQLDEAHLANAIFDAHRDDPEFGYRFLADEIRREYPEVSDRVVWRICRDHRWWSVFGKPKRSKASKPGTPSHDDLVKRDFTAAAANQLWLSNITEHWTREGKPYVCAIKDVSSNRIVGWAIDERMKARLVVAAIEMVVARRSSRRPPTLPPTSRCCDHRLSPASFALGKFIERSPTTTWSAQWAKSAPPATTPPWNPSSPSSRRMS